jgi:hypothetical protein
VRFFFSGLLLVVGAALVEVIDKFLFLVLLITDAEFEFALLGAQHDGLAVHPAHHVEGRLGFAAQGQFEKIFLDAGLDGFAQLGLDLEEAICRTEALDALVRPLVVVVFNPEFDPLARRLKALELGAAQELLPEALPEALDFAERHGMMRTALEVSNAVLFQLGFEAAGAAPGSVLAAIIGEHLPGRRELCGGNAIHLNNGLRGRTAEQVRPNYEARVIIQEGDQVSVTTAEPEGKNIALPHLIGGGPLEEARTGEVALFGRRGLRHQLRLMQSLAHRLGAGRQKEPAAQQLRDAFDAEGRVRRFELPDFFGDGRRQLGLTPRRRRRLQTRLARQLVLLEPEAEDGFATAQFLTNEVLTEALLQVQGDGLAFELRGIAQSIFGRARPLTGRCKTG